MGLKRRGYERQQPGLVGWQREVLLGGTPMLSCFAKWRDWRDGGEGEAAWKLHRRELLAGYRPGARPWAWWKFEHGQGKPGGGLGRGAREWGEFRELKRLGVLQPGEAAAFLAKHPGGPPPEAADRVPAVLALPGEVPERSAEAGEVGPDAEDTIQ